MDPASLSFYTVDRFEGGLAVLVADDGTAVDLPRSRLPGGARAGSVLRVPVNDRGQPDWASAEPDEGERQRRLERAQEIVKRLRMSDPGGDVML